MNPEQVMSNLADAYIAMCERYENYLNGRYSRIRGHYGFFICLFESHPDIQKLELLLEQELELIDDETYLMPYGDQSTCLEIGLDKSINENVFLDLLCDLGVSEAKCDELADSLRAERTEDDLVRSWAMERAQYFILCVQDVRSKFNAGLIEEAKRIACETQKQMNELRISRPKAT